MPDMKEDSLGWMHHGLEKVKDLVRPTLLDFFKGKVRVPSTSEVLLESGEFKASMIFWISCNHSHAKLRLSSCNRTTVPKDVETSKTLERLDLSDEHHSATAPLRSRLKSGLEVEPDCKLAKLLASLKNSKNVSVNTI